MYLPSAVMRMTRRCALKKLVGTGEDICVQSADIFFDARANMNWREIIATSLLATLSEFAGPPVAEIRVFVDAITKIRDEKNESSEEEDDDVDDD